MSQRHEVLAELLQAVNRGIFEQLRDVLQVYGLPVTSMIVIRQIHHDQGITITEISRRIGTVKSHVSKTIESLALEGYVEKRPDSADQRLVRVFTTERADSQIRQMQADVRQRLSELVAAVPEEKVEAVIDVLQILRAVLGQGKGC